MRPVNLYLCLGFFAAQVLADGPSIVAAIREISNATVALNKTLNTFPNNPLLAIGSIAPLLVDSVVLLDDINDGTKVAWASDNLTLPETIGVAQATITLSQNVVATLRNLVATKPRFDKLLVISPVVLINLKLEKEATDRFGAAVIAKVPPAFQAAARSFLDPITAAFKNSIASYEI